MKQVKILHAYTFTICIIAQNKMLCVSQISLSNIPHWIYVSSNPTNTKRYYNVCTMLDQRRRVYDQSYHNDRLGVCWV